MSKFHFLTGDTNWSDYGGKWYRDLGNGRFHILELLNWHEHESDPTHTYNVDLSEVDTQATPQETIQQAKESCGWDDMPDNSLALAECLHSYGCKAPLWSENGNNYSKLLSAAKAESHELDDPDAYETAMSKPVNLLGSTAREYMQGDINSAMVRGVQAGNEESKLVARMYGASPETIKAVEGSTSPGFVSASVTLGKVPSDDPLAYTMGYMRAIAGAGLDEPRDDLAPAYVEGYRVGVSVKAGNQPQPDWVQGGAS